MKIGRSCLKCLKGHREDFQERQNCVFINFTISVDVSNPVLTNWVDPLLLKLIKHGWKN